MTRLLTLACAIALLVLGACNLGTEPGCDICVTEAVVFGRATEVSGAPVANATIEVLLMSTGCASSEQVAFGNSVLTNASGDYRLNVGTPHAPADHCVAVRATPAAGASLSAVTDTVPTLRFRYTGSAPFIYDSVRVDLVLPPP